jgi:hypothetical protein
MTINTQEGSTATFGLANHSCDNANEFVALFDDGIVLGG